MGTHIHIACTQRHAHSPYGTGPREMAQIFLRSEYVSVDYCELSVYTKLATELPPPRNLQLKTASLQRLQPRLTSHFPYGLPNKPPEVPCHWQSWVPPIRVSTPSSDPSFPVYVSVFSSLAILSQGSRTHYTSNTGAWFAMSCAKYTG